MLRSVCPNPFDLDADIIKYNNNIQDAKTGESGIPRTDSHYMTVVGLYKYADKNPMDYKYVLEVVSWGDVYYIDYDEYAQKLGYFTNILSVY